MDRGRFAGTPGTWDIGGGEVAFAGTEMVARPSLLAALDVPFKAMGAVVLVLFPVFFTGAVVTREPLAAAGLFTILQFVQVLPAFLLAFAPAVRIVFTRYLIDDEGIRIHTQVLAKSEARVSWEKVTAIRHRITLIDRLLGIERVDIIAYGERGATLRLVGLRDGRRLRDLAANKMRSHASVEALLRSD